MVRLTTLSLLLPTAQAAYVWPSKYDALEDMLAIHSGAIRMGFSDLVFPCSTGPGEVGIQNAAEWIRTAFHDVATHDASAGTGGLDGSIMFETERAENGGAAFNNTLGALEEFISEKTSVADMLALSVVVASAGCGGPKLTLKAGRTDAADPGPSGVPMPETSLETTRETFTRAGFNQEEMIALVACGHTIGRVHSVNHPELVDGEPSAANNAEFDTSPHNFDNTVVVEYLENETANPLIINANETLNSDKRIFSSDGNVTMNAMADPAAFQAKCGEVLQRMIDTVPSEVALSPIEIVDVKPYINKVVLQKDGTILLEGRVRVRTSPNTPYAEEDISAALAYKDRDGKEAAEQIATTRLRLKGGQSYGPWDNVFIWFEFTKSIPADKGISSFNVVLTKPSTGAVTVLDNAGTGGYPVNSDIIRQAAQSCLTGSGEMLDLTVTAAVRKELAEAAGGVPTLRLIRRVRRQGVMIPKLEADEVSFEAVNVEEKAGYVFFKATTKLALTSWHTQFDVLLKDKCGKEVASLKQAETNDLMGNTCQSL